MARAPVAAAKAVRVRVDEFRFAARDARPFGVHEPAIDRERRCLGFASDRDRIVDRQIPRMIEIEIGNGSRESIGIGEAGRGIASGVARDRERLGDGRVDCVGREVGGARVSAPLPDEHRHADALVAVVGDRLDLAVSHRDALPDRLRDLGFRCRCAAGARGAKHRFGHALQLGRRQRKALALGSAGICHWRRSRRGRRWKVRGRRS